MVGGYQLETASDRLEAPGHGCINQVPGQYCRLHCAATSWPASADSPSQILACERSTPLCTPCFKLKELAVSKRVLFNKAL